MESDFSAFHHLRPSQVYALPGPEFCALAFRLPAYPGVLQARIRMEVERERGPAAPAGVTVVESTPDVLLSTPGLDDLFDVR